MTTNAVFPAILFFQRGVIICDTKKSVSCNSRDVLLLSSPKALFWQKHSWFVIFSCLFFFFCIPFQHSMFLFSSSNPFWDNILVLFILLYLCCPFPFFIGASFLPTSFLTSPSRIQLAFIFGCLALLFSIFEFCLFMLGVSFLLVFVVGFCLVFFWLLFSPFFSFLVFLFFVFLSVAFC